LESLIKFKFESYGAILVIQRWFRKWRFYNKLKWQKKYRKLIAKYKAQKLLFSAIRKSGLLLFSQPDLDDRRKVIIASCFVVTRLMRGFLGRQKYKRYLRRKEIFEEKKDEASILVQSFIRMWLVILRNPLIGYRYRVWARRRLLYFQGKLPVRYSLWNECPADVRLNRRASFLFPYLRLSSLEKFPELDFHATKIQCLARSILARAKVCTQRQLRRIMAVKRLQKWWLGLGWRRKLRISLSRIQPLWKKKIKNKLKMKHAAIKVQTKFRSFKQRRWYLNLRNRRQIAVARLHRWAKYRICLQRIRRKLAMSRSHREIQRAGADLFQASYLRWLYHFVWMGVKKTKQKDVDVGNHELQRIFSANALNNGLDLTKILKLLKECKDLMIEDFTTNAVELQFTKIKNANEKRIDYAKFVDLLANLSVVRFLRMDPPKGCWDEIAHQNKEASKVAMSTTPPKGEKLSGGKSGSTEHLGPLQTLKAFSLGGLNGKAAFITKFVLTFFVQLHDFKRVVEFLGARSAESLANRMVYDNAQLIINFVLNRNAVKQITKDLLTLKKDKQNRRIYDAAKRIQQSIRGYLARRQITKMAQLLYSKYVDGETESEYWFNPRTQTSYWTKPKMLGIYDCGMAVRMPKPEEMFAVNCSICEKVSATCYCRQCDGPMCTGCFAKVHKSGQRKGHQHILVENCVQCDFQIGTKFCQTCKDIFCDSCFRHMHKKGRLRFHSCVRYSSVCDECEDRSAHWREVSTMGSLGVKNWCTACYQKVMSKDPVESKAKRDKNGLERIRFLGKEVQLYMQQKEKEKKENEIKEVFEKRQKELHVKKMLDAVVTIQRVFRGSVGRRRIHQFIEARKEMMLVRLDEDRLRESWLYKLKTLFGFPPKLKSDTPLERVKKLYPWYMHRIVAECIENQWSEACKLLVQHEERLSQSAQKFNILQRMIAKWHVMWVRRKCDQMEKKMGEVEALVDVAATSYFNGEASGALPEAKLRALKAAMNKLEKQLQKVLETKDQLDQELYEAEEHMYDCVGPRGLETLVHERRRYGVPMPFRLSIRHNSRLALVEWLVEDSVMMEGGQLDQGDELAEENDDARSNLTDDPLVNSSKRNRSPTNYEEPRDPLSTRLTLDRVRRSQSSKSRKFQDMLQYEMRPGEWRKKLRTGDLIFIDGATFAVSVPLIAKKRLRPKSAKDASGTTSATNTARNADSSSNPDHSHSFNNLDSSGNPRPTTAGKDRSGVSDGDTSGAERKKNKSSSRATTSDGQRSNQDGDDEEGDGDEVEEEKELIEPFTENHIPLDRPWVLPDRFGADVYKKVSSIFYMRPYYYAKKLFINSYPFQKFAQIMGINWHKIAALSEYIAEFFDEESPNRPYYLSLAMAATEKKHYWLKMSKTVVNMSYDFSLRKYSYRQVKRLAKMLYSVVKMIRSAAKAANNAVHESPFDYWQRSLEKSDVRIFYEIAADTEIVLGEFRMDLHAPLDIMREYIYRNFREKLNETVGESFLFLQIDEESEVEKILPRDDEFRTASKTFANKRTDNKTFETFLAVTIIRDQQRARVLIPDLEAKEEEDNEEASLINEDEDD
jgi:hypothetical protein